MANDINIIIGGDVRQLERALDDAVRRVRSSTDTMSGIVSGFQNFLLGAFSLDKLKEGLDFATTFDDNLRQVQAAAKLTAEQFELIKQKALELGAEPGQTPEMIAAGMADAARAGQDFNQILDSINGTAQLAAGSELNFSEATEASVDILAQFGLTSKDTAALTDVLIAGANSASVKVGQLAESFKFAGSLSHVLGESVIDTEAALLVLANAGLKAEQGGTALRGVWTQLIKHSDTLQESFGVAVSKMENGQRVFRSLDEIMGDLSKSGIQADEIFQIFGKTAGPGAAVLLQAGQEGLLKYEEQLKSAGGAGQEVAETLQSGLGGSVRTITSQFQNAVILLVDQVTPAIGFVADNIYLLNSAVLGGAGVINTMREAYDTMLATAIQGISYFAEISDAIGVTSGQAEHLRRISADFTYVAEQMGEQAGKAFNDMVDSVGTATDAQKKHKEAVDLTALSYKKDVEEHDKRVEDIVSGTEKMSKAEVKSAKEREKALDDMYKTLDSHSSDYYEREAGKLLEQADKFRELGGSEVEIQQHAYDELSKLSEAAYAAGNESAGIYLDNLRSGFSEVTTYISKEHQELIDKFQELSGETVTITDTTDWESMKAEVQDLEDDINGISDLNVNDTTDWGSVEDDINTVSNDINNVPDLEISADMDTQPFDNATAKINSDLAAIGNSMASAVKKSGGGGTMTVDTSDADALIKAINELNKTPTLDPFHLTRKKYVQLLAGMGITYRGSYAGGGYTGDSPRTGGLDGQGGFFAILHPQETVIDHTIDKSNNNSEATEIFNKLLAAVNNIQSGNRIVIENITVDKKMTSEELDNLVEDLNRRSRRG